MDRLAPYASLSFVSPAILYTHAQVIVNVLDPT
jgi:hypothetical protein